MLRRSIYLLAISALFSVIPAFAQIPHSAGGMSGGIDHPRYGQESGGPPPSRNQQMSAPLADDEWESIFNYDRSITGGAIYCMLRHGDSIFVGGDFTRLGGVVTYHVGVYNLRSGEWESMAGGLYGPVQSMTMFEGKLIVGGSFEYARDDDQTPIRRLAVWDGSTWSEFGGGADNSVIALATYKGQLIAGGHFKEIGNVSARYIARWMGDTWEELGGGVSDGVLSLLPKGDTLFAAGEFYRAAGDPVGNIAMFAKETWQPLGEGLDAEVGSLAWYNDTLWAGGDFSQSLGDFTPLYNLAKFDGSAWQPAIASGVWGTNGLVEALLATPNGLFIGGSFSEVGGVKAHNIARYFAGRVDSLGLGTWGYVADLATVGDTVFVAGGFTRAGTSSAQGFAAFVLNQNTWASGVTRGATENYYYLRVDALASSDNYLYAGGYFTRAGGVLVNGIAAFDKARKRWVAMGKGLDGGARRIVVRGTKVYVVGQFQRAGDIYAQNIACWDEETKSWSAMGTGSMRRLRALDADESGVYASVFFDVEGSSYRNAIGRWDGQQWHRLEGTYYGWANMLRKIGDELYLGGYIYEIDGELMNNIAVRRSDGWYPMGDGFDGIPYDLELDQTGSPMVVGTFTESGGVETIGVARFDGTTWGAVGEGINDYAYDVEEAYGKLYVGGWMSRADGKTVRRLVTWDGTEWSDAAGGVDHVIYAMARDQQSLYVGGYLGDAGYDDVESWRLGKLNFGNASVGPETAAQTVCYPNPASDYVYVAVEEGSAHVTVFDLLGRTIACPLSQHTNKVRLDVRSLPVGSYFVEVKQNDNTARHPVRVSR